MEVKLGVLARDKITGFTGIVVCSAQYLYGCNQWGLSSKIDEKGESKTNFYDEGRIEYVGVGVAANDVAAPSGRPGGPNRDAPGNQV